MCDLCDGIYNSSDGGGGGGTGVDEWKDVTADALWSSSNITYVHRKIFVNEKLKLFKFECFARLSYNVGATESMKEIIEDLPFTIKENFFSAAYTSSGGGSSYSDYYAGCYFTNDSSLNVDNPNYKSKKIYAVCRTDGNGTINSFGGSGFGIIDELE